MLKTLVKVSAITNLSDARYCAGMGVDLLGFPLGKISIDQFTEIRNWLAGVQIVGEFSTNDAAEIKAKVAEYKPDVLEKFLDFLGSVYGYDIRKSVTVVKPSGHLNFSDTDEDTPT